MGRKALIDDALQRAETARQLAAQDLASCKQERDAARRTIRAYRWSATIIALIVGLHLVVVIPTLRAIAAGAFGAAAIALRDAGSGWSSHHRGGW